MDSILKNVQIHLNLQWWVPFNVFWVEQLILKASIKSLTIHWRTRLVLSPHCGLVRLVLILDGPCYIYSRVCFLKNVKILEIICMRPQYFSICENQFVHLFFINISEKLSLHTRASNNQYISHIQIRDRSNGQPKFMWRRHDFHQTESAV